MNRIISTPDLSSLSAYDKYLYWSTQCNAIETREDRKLKSLSRTCSYAGKGRKSRRNRR